MERVLNLVAEHPTGQPLTSCFVNLYGLLYYIYTPALEKLEENCPDQYQFKSFE